MTDDPARATADPIVTAPDEPASVQVMVGPQVTTVVLAGEVDIDLAEEMAQATEAAHLAGFPVVVHCEQLTFIDSSGLAFLARLAARSPAPVRLVGAPERLRWLIQLTRLQDVLEVVDP